MSTLKKIKVATTIAASGLPIKTQEDLLKKLGLPSLKGGKGNPKKKGGTVKAPAKKMMYGGKAKKKK